MIDQDLPIAVIGAGPVGLAAAAHIIDRGEVPLVFEAGEKIASSVRAWSHVRMFSPWEFTVDRVAVKLLRDAGWTHPPKDELPTGGELVASYLEPLAALPMLRDRIRLGTRVVAVSRKGFDKVRSSGRAEQPFVIRTLDGSGREASFEAKAVIDASGTWTQPNPAGADGLPAIGEAKLASRIAYGIPDVLATERNRYAGKTVIVVGGGHSAINTLVELAELRESAPGTSIVWAMRKENVETAYGGEGDDALPARGALGSQARLLVETGVVSVLSPFRISRIEENGTVLAVTGEHAGKPTSVRADEIIVATGFRPDLSFLREVRLSLDPWLESSGQIGPLIDPNLHSCGTVRPHGAKELAHPESGFYIAGIKSYGRAPTFLLATGHEQVRSIVAALSGDIAAAERVELQLPETGVCVTRPVGKRAVPSDVGSAGSACCGPSGGKVTTVPVEIAAPARTSCGSRMKKGSGCGTKARDPQSA